MSGDLGGQPPKIWFRTLFGPRFHLLRTSFNLQPQPVKTQPREVLERLCNGLLRRLLLLLLLLLVLLLLGKARFLSGERRDLWKGWKLCGRNQKHKKITWKKIDPISVVPWGSGWKGWLAWSRICHRNHRNMTSITSKFVCWKCYETWCAMWRMILKFPNPVETLTILKQLKLRLTVGKQVLPKYTGNKNVIFVSAGAVQKCAFQKKCTTWR